MRHAVSERGAESRGAVLADPVGGACVSGAGLKRGAPASTFPRNNELGGVKPVPMPSRFPVKDKDAAVRSRLIAAGGASLQVEEDQ